MSATKNSPAKPGDPAKSLLEEALSALGLQMEGRVEIGSVQTPQVFASNASPEYQEPPWWGKFVWSMTSTNKRGACLTGPRGSGKTSAPHELSRRAGKRLITFQAAHGETMDGLVGVRDLIEGKTVFTPGPLPTALKEDCWLLIEEANMMHPGVFSKMNTLLDGSGDKLLLPDGKQIGVGPGFRLVLAFNEGSAYTGTREINAALRDRLLPIYAGYLPEGTEVKIVVNKTCCDPSTAVRVVSFANKVRAARDKLGFDLSPRALFDLLELMRDLGMDWKDAFETAILDRVGDPLDKKPQRDSIEQVANLDGLYSWPKPKFRPVGSLASDASEPEPAPADCITGGAQ